MKTAHNSRITTPWQMKAKAEMTEKCYHIRMQQRFSVSVENRQNRAVAATGSSDSRNKTPLRWHLLSKGREIISLLFPSPRFQFLIPVVLVLSSFVFISFVELKRSPAKDNWGLWWNLSHLTICFCFESGRSNQRDLHLAASGFSFQGGSQSSCALGKLNKTTFKK